MHVQALQKDDACAQHVYATNYFGSVIQTPRREYSGPQEMIQGSHAASQLYDVTEPITGTGDTPANIRLPTRAIKILHN